MAHNRRKADGEMTFAWVATRMLLFFLLVGLLLGVTLLQRRNLRMGEELRVLDRDLVSAKQKTAILEAQLARCKSPTELENRMVRMNIALVRPTEEQIRRLVEPDDGGDEIVRPQMLAQAELPPSRLKHP